MGLRVARGRQRAVAFGVLVLKPLRLQFGRVGRRRRLAVQLPVLLAHRLGDLVLLDQAGLEQLFLQGSAHTQHRQWLREIANDDCSVVVRDPSAASDARERFALAA